jgi:hypothetical protein
MLEIRRVNRYQTARYPIGRYVRNVPPLPESLVKRGAMSLLALAVLETLSCDNGTGTTGPPPTPPDLMTENEARQVIEQVFADSGIQMERDLRLIVHLAGNDSLDLVLDGYNDSLQVGYEYVYSPEDRESFDPHARQALDSLVAETGPYIEPIDDWPKGYESYLRMEVDAFIDTLKSHGII